MNRQYTLDKVVDKLRHHEGVIRIGLFGSRARRIETPESDYDIMVWLDPDVDFCPKDYGEIFSLPEEYDIKTRHAENLDMPTINFVDRESWAEQKTEALDSDIMSDMKILWEDRSAWSEAVRRDRVYSHHKPNSIRHRSSNPSDVSSKFTDWVDRRYETAEPIYLSHMAYSSIFILPNGRVKLIDSKHEHGDAVFGFFKGKGGFPSEFSKMPSYGEAASWAVEQGIVRSVGAGNEYNFQVPISATESQIKSIEKVSGYFDEVKWDIHQYPFIPENDGTGFRSLSKRINSIRNKKEWS